MARGGWFLTISAVALLGGTGQAMAQTAEAPGEVGSLFNRQRAVSVMDREHPEYVALGLPLGTFTALPKIEVGVEGNDNILAQKTGTKSDAVFVVDPSINLKSNWSRRTLNLFLTVPIREYARYSSESTVDVSGGFDGSIEVARAQLIAGASSGRFTQARYATEILVDSVKPIRFTETQAFVGIIREFTRVRLTGRYDWSQFKFDNGVNPLGGIVVQDSRSRKVSVVTGKAEYALDPTASIFITAAYNDHSYDLKPPIVPADRTSHGELVDLGFSFEASSLLRGSIEAGYLKQEFPNSRASNISGLSANGKVEWFPTQLTTVTVTGGRVVNDAADNLSPATLTTSVQARVDHELLRNLILSAQAGYETDDYQGVQRKDKVYTVYLGAKYALNRRISLTAAYNRVDQQSSGVGFGPAFKVDRFTVSTALQF